jgi:CRP-like cAMP-binding protein
MIQDFPLFEGLSQEEADLIAQSSIKRTIPAKTVFIEQGTNSETAFFILEGSVNIFRIDENGNEVSISVLGKGDIVGEMALIDHSPRSAYAKTLSTVETLVLSSDSFRNILKNYPDISIRLLASLSKRIRDSDQRLEDFVTKSLKTRSWNALKTLEIYFPDGEIALSHEELATIVGATRARITEVLNELEKENKVSLSHRKIILL